MNKHGTPLEENVSIKAGFAANSRHSGTLRYLYYCVSSNKASYGVVIAVASTDWASLLMRYTVIRYNNL